MDKIGLFNADLLLSLSDRWHYWLLCFRYIIDETELIINDVQDEDEGVYGCEVITSLDMAEASGSLTVVGMTIGGKKKKSMEQIHFLHYTIHLDRCVCDFCSFTFMYASSLSDRPDSPSMLQITEPGVHSVTLLWVPGDNHKSPILGRYMMICIAHIILQILRHGWCGKT